jgi:hypothetical protein
VIRVCGAVGTWQQITLAAGLAQMLADRGTPAEDARNYLVLYEPGGTTPELRDLMGRLARAVWPWAGVAWADDLLDFRRRIPQARYDRVLRTLRERVGVPPGEVDQLWLCWLTRPPEKLLMEAWPAAEVFVYEDGLTSYMPVTVAEGMDGGGLLRGLLDRWRPVRRLRRSHWDLDPRHRDRVGGLYLCASPETPPPDALAHAPCRFVDDRHLRAALGRVADALPEARETGEDTDDGPTLLFLGQCLHRNKLLERDAETALYRGVLDGLLARGYRVLWKEHPRATEPFYPELRAGLGTADAGRFARFEPPHALPVEVVAGRMRLAGCVSGISTSLFYLPRLYGLPCYTYAGELTPHMRGNFVLQNEMVRRAVPPVTALPSSAAAPAPAAMSA